MVPSNVAQMSAKELEQHIAEAEKRHKLLKRELMALLRIRRAQEGELEETDD